MNFQQLRSAREAARRQYKLTEVAQALHTSQPGISRQLRELEAEVGLGLFRRAGKRLVGLTAAGERLMPIVERILDHAEQLRQVGRDHAQANEGTLAIAATHSQARYALPHAVFDFRTSHPAVGLRLHQGSADRVARLLLAQEVDIGIATESLDAHPGLVCLPCYAWTHVVLVPRGHPLDDGRPLSLARLAVEPLVTYCSGLTGRRRIDEAFAAAGLSPRLSLEAMDADVIKTYVGLGLGVGIVAAMAHQPERDQGLVALDARHLFGSNLTRLALRRGVPVRQVVYAFIQAFAPPLDRAAVDAWLNASPGAEPAPIAAPMAASIAASIAA